MGEADWTDEYLSPYKEGDVVRLNEMGYGRLEGRFDVRVTRADRWGFYGRVLAPRSERSEGLCYFSMAYLESHKLIEEADG